MFWIAIAAGCSEPPPPRHVRAPPPRFAIDLEAVRPAPETYEDDDLAHLRVLLTEDEIARWATLDPPARAAWFRSVWGRVDASPTTPENERKEEHYRRLAYVRAHFAIERDPGWDRRGELLLRYGSPQQRTVIGGQVKMYVGLIPPQEIWVYSWLDQAFQMEDALLHDDFQESWGGERISSRPDATKTSGGEPIDMGSTRSLERFGPAFEGEKEARAFERMLGRGAKAAEGALPHAFFLDQGGAKLDFVFDIVHFAGDSGKTRVEIHSAFDAGSLEYEERDGAWTATLDVVVVAKTPEFEEVARASHALEDVRRSAGDRAGQIVLDQVELELEPGPHRLAIEARDRRSGNVGIFLAQTAVLDLSRPVLALSDIQRSQDVQRSSAPHPFRKGEYLVVPYPLGTYPPGVPAYLFFEIYHLALSPRGETFYTVDLTVRSRAPDGSAGAVVPGVGTSFDARGRSATAREFVALETGALESALYDVEIRVTDRVSGQSASGSVTFGVVGAGGESGREKSVRQ
jgi:GWxTD domain-containing protein